MNLRSTGRIQHGDNYEREDQEERDESGSPLRHTGATPKAVTDLGPGVTPFPRAAHR